MILAGILYALAGIFLVEHTFKIYDSIKKLKLLWIESEKNKKYYRTFLYIISTLLMISIGLILVLSIIFITYEKK